MLLFFVISVHTDGNRTVIEQLYFHVCAELSGLYYLARFLAQNSTKILIEWYRLLGFSSMYIAWSVALLIACQQCKLADDKDFAVSLVDIQVHNPVIIVKNTK